MAVKRIEALELSEILGSLLSSVVNAQTQSSDATVAFIQDVGFETTRAGRRIRTVTLRYSKKDENGDNAEFEVDVPLLSMVNVPSIAVREAKLSFSYDVVTSSTGTEPGAGPSTSILGPIEKFKPAILTGFVKRNSSTNTSEKRTTSIDLDVTLEQQEIPIGIERLFDLAELGITERPAPDVT